MKITQTFVQAVCAGALLLLATKSQAVVIGGNLYRPLTITVTLDVLGTGSKAGTVVQQTATSKNILNDLVNEQGFTFPKGTLLALGPNNDVYAITATAVITNLSTAGYFSLTTGVTLDPTAGTFGVTAYKAANAGFAEFKFGDDGDLGTLANNAGAFDLTGAYVINFSAAAPSKGKQNETLSFVSTSFNGLSYWSNVDAINLLPMSANVSATATGKVP